MNRNIKQELTIELNELEGKYNRLVAFFKTETYAELSDEMGTIMEVQAKAMNDYIWALRMRIKILNKEGK